MSCSQLSWPLAIPCSSTSAVDAIDEHGQALPCTISRDYIAKLVSASTDLCLRAIDSAESSCCWRVVLCVMALLCSYTVYNQQVLCASCMLAWQLHLEQLLVSLSCRPGCLVGQCFPQQYVFCKHVAMPCAALLSCNIITPIVQIHRNYRSEQGFSNEMLLS